MANSTIPIPDPTKLTTDAVDRAKDDIRREMSILFGAAKELIEQKFTGVATEFTMRDIALAAAFKAAEAQVKQQNESNTLAADKAASAFTKQIDGLDEKIVDIKERFSELQSRNYAAIGGYLVGVIGIIGVVVTVMVILLRTHG